MSRKFISLKFCSLPLVQCFYCLCWSSIALWPHSTPHCLSPQHAPDCTASPLQINPPTGQHPGQGQTCVALVTTLYTWLPLCVCVAVVVLLHNIFTCSWFQFFRLKKLFGDFSFHWKIAHLKMLSLVQECAILERKSTGFSMRVFVKADSQYQQLRVIWFTFSLSPFLPHFSLFFSIAFPVLLPLFIFSFLLPLSIVLSLSHSLSLSLSLSSPAWLDSLTPCSS